jgi:hypothetical protein
MSTGNSQPSPAAGPDILARYLHAYVSARRLSELERPWGLGDRGLDDLWSRLIEALAVKPHDLSRTIAEELSDEDREHIVETICPLIFALPMRTYPAEVHATRKGPRFELSVRNSASIDSDAINAAPVEATELMEKKASKGRPEPVPHPLGYLPAVLTAPLLRHLRRVLKIRDREREKEVTVSSGGRRRRVHITILPRNRGILIRFIRPLPSPSREISG